MLTLSTSNPDSSSEYEIKIAFANFMVKCYIFIHLLAHSTQHTAHSTQHTAHSTQHFNQLSSINKLNVGLN